MLVRFDVDQERLQEQVADICKRTGLRSDEETISAWYDSKLIRSETTEDDNSPMFKRVAPLWEELVSLHERQS